MDTKEKIEKFREKILKKGVFRNNEYKIITPEGKNGDWILDMRNVFMQPESLNLIAEIFWALFGKEYPFQIGGQEISAIPLISAIIIKGHELNKPVNGFIVRKERKNTGLQKIIEGDINNNKIILVDDSIRTGETFSRQINILKNINKKVNIIFAVIEFKKSENYQFIKENEIKFYSIFSLEDIGLEIPSKITQNHNNNFKTSWHFQSPNPNYYHIFPKSNPAIDEKKIYFGGDNGHFWALNQVDGSVSWNFKIGYSLLNKNTFSSPLIYKNSIYFGSAGGNIYSLDKNNGKVKWKYSWADWAGESSPDIAPEINSLFIGLQFGLFKKKGSIISMDINTGKKKWEYIIPTSILSSPVYIKEKNLVVIGANDHCVYSFDANNGNLKWKFKTEGEIKGSFVFDEKNNALLFGSLDTHLYSLNINSGNLIYKFKTQDEIWSTPAIYKDSIILSSTDKIIYCLNLKSGDLKWQTNTNGKIFSSPKIIEDKIYIGSNDGKLYEIEPESGFISNFFQTTERITGNAIYNEKSKNFFISTYANEIYCIYK